MSANAASAAGDPAVPPVGGASLGSGIQSGLDVLRTLRTWGNQAQSEVGACLAPLLEAIGWTGRPRHLAEAIPHFIDSIGIDDFRETLANLNLVTSEIRSRQDHLNPGLLPCLFVPDRGSPRVVLERGEDGEGAFYKIYDGFTRSARTTRVKGIRGTAFVVRQSDGALVQRDDSTWMAELFVRFRKLVGLALLSTLLINLLSIAMPLFMMTIYDVVIPSASVIQLYYLLAGIALAIGIEWFFRRLRSAVLAHAAGRIDYLIGTAGFRQVLLLPLSMTENEPLGAQISHLQEFESIREIFAGPLGETIFDIPFVFISLAVIALLAGELVFVPICAAVLLVLTAVVTAPFIKRTLAGSGGAKTRQQRFIIEAVSGMRAIKFAGAEKVWMDRFRMLSASSAISEFRISMLNNFVQTAGQTVMLGAGVASVGFGAGMVMDKTLTVGALVASMALGWRVLGPFQSMLSLLNRATQIRASLRQINHLMRMMPERIPGRVPPKRTFKGRITFIGVGYRHRPDADPALNGVTFEISPGEVVAITGANGAGKTTVANLASGLYKPQFGQVLIDGVDIRQIDVIDIRQNIGLVPQNSEMLYGTVAQNLRLSHPTATDAELRDAAVMADIHDAIESLGEGYDTRLTERVLSELPEGFKQKLAIARALIRRPPILVFDEPGQMLDERGDRAFMRAVEELRGKTTVVVITHRPSHMRVADRLIVLNAGRLQFNGDPAEALARMTGEAA